MTTTPADRSQQQQRKRAEIIARTIAPIFENRPGLCELASAIHLALDATDVDAAAWATFNAGQELGDKFQSLRTSHDRLVEACQKAYAQAIHDPMRDLDEPQLAKLLGTALTEAKVVTV